MMARVLLSGILIIFSGILPVFAEGVHLSAYYYPWYDKDGRHWDEGYFGKGTGDAPALGEYSSRDPETIIQHIKWSRQNGISNWVCAWWGKDSWEDVTLNYRIAPVLNQVEDTAGNRPATFCVFYESEGLLGLDPEKGIDFDPLTTRKFIKDFGYLSETFFKHPSYYRIDDRPVVYLYLSRAFSGDYVGAIQKVRDAAKMKGIDLFLVGDEIYWGEPDLKRIRQFDAITAYNMHGPSPKFDVAGDWTNFVISVKEVYKMYKNAADDVEVGFIPGIIPGFNSHGADPSRSHYVIPRKYKDAAGEMKSILGQFVSIAESVLDKNLQTATITSFNEWHEGTQLEPSRDSGVSYPELLKLSKGGSPE